MNKKRFLRMWPLLVLMSGVAVVGESASASTVSPENPLTVSADYMRYSEDTGDVEAKGRVDISHGADWYHTGYAEGNLVKQIYRIPGDLTWENDTLDVTGRNLRYDGKSQEGLFDDLSGWQEKRYYFRGNSGSYSKGNNRISVENGFFTTKHAMAKVPDYGIEAERIDIYPNDHYTTKNVRLKVKNTTLLSLPTYSASLKESRTSGLWSLIPRPTFDSHNGLGLKSRFYILLSAQQNIQAYWDNVWYTKVGYKPSLGIEWGTRLGTLSAGYVHADSTYNEDSYWIKKWPSFSFHSKDIPLGKSSLFLRFSGETGTWEEDEAKGGHRGYEVTLFGEPISLGKDVLFRWKAGYLQDVYGYRGVRKGYVFDGHERRNNAYYTVGLEGTFGRWSPFVTFTDNHISGHTPYYYDDYDLRKPLAFGTKVQLTRLDAVGVRFTMDTSSGTLEHRTWTYYRDMHSFRGELSYDDNERSWELKIEAKDFRF